MSRITMKKVKIRIEGVGPLLMHNGKLADPTVPVAKEMKEVSSKRKKTDSDFENLKWLEFKGGLYFDEKAGPYIPDTWIEKNVRDGATANKLGKAVLSGVVCSSPINPLEYEGPRTIAEMYKDSQFVDTRGVVVKQNRIMRTRPIFREWACSFELQIVPEIISVSSVEIAIDRAGLIVGLGDYRPKFGRYTLAEFKEV